MAWSERVADRSPSVQRSRVRSVAQARPIVAAARKLIREQGGTFTTQELVKEAGVALQTFYRHFGGKDDLLLSVFEEAISEGCGLLQLQGAEIESPLERLRLYVTGPLRALSADSIEMTRFTTAEHYRIHQLYADDLTIALQPYVDMLVPVIEAAAAEGSLAPVDVERDAWFVMQCAMATFHHYSFSSTEVPVDEVSSDLWSFCVRALGGRPA